jgi:PelA/Pel-15E family pectate lyase
MKLTMFAIVALALSCCICELHADEDSLRAEVTSRMKEAATFYREQVASHGGYVYFYSLDLTQRWGEGPATSDQIWVQPPGTPTVGMAYLKAYEATADPYYLDAARDAAESLVYGQLSTGGWSNSIDCKNRELGYRYAGGNKRREGTSSLDDGQTQSALQLVMLVDEALDFDDREIHQSALFGLDALLAAQFPNGAFPQGWKGPVADHPVMKASYPDYDWRTDGRIKNYWDMYTLNDNVCGYVADALIVAHKVYGSDRYLQSLRKLGDFLILAQMPDPQPAWAQQYNYEMKPIWARAFEPPAIAGDESQEAIETLMKISAATGDRKYLEPIPRALAYLKRSLLPEDQLARYYELETNRPLYMARHGKRYSLTYDDSDLPAHYGWKWDSRIDELERKYILLKDGGVPTTQPVNVDNVRLIVSTLDQHGRWVSTYDGKRLVGQAKMPLGAKYLSSERFSKNLATLSEFLQAEWILGGENAPASRTR